MKAKIALLTLVCGFQLSMAQTLDEVLNRHFDAVGGKTAIKGIKTRKTEITLATPDGNEIMVVSTLKRPGLYYQQQTLPNGAEVIKLVNAKGGFMSDMSGTINPMPPPVLKAHQQFDADLDGPLFDYALKSHKLTLVGVEKVDGVDCHKIAVTLNNGSTMNYFIDKSTHLINRTTRTANGPMGPIEVITTFKDYRVVNGIKISHEQSVEQGAMGIFTAKVTKVQFNIEVPDSVFDSPK